MIEFEKPRIECLKLDNDNMYAKFVCEPLERGYGITLGNSTLSLNLLIWIETSLLSSNTTLIPVGVLNSQKT